jgi:hypothetical protein
LSVQISAFSQQVAQAETILIVGGRSVGIEVMGEIFSLFPDSKNVILVHSSPSSLMDGWIPGGIEKLNGYVQVIFFTSVFGNFKILILELDEILEL